MAAWCGLSGRHAVASTCQYLIQAPTTTYSALDPLQHCPTLPSTTQHYPNQNVI